jgi:diaminopropionate ammonia-lyase
VTRVLFLPRDSQAALEPAPTDPSRFHAALEGYAPTPLRESAALADRLGVRRVLIKMETDRLGLPSFKVLGASWATLEALRPWIPSAWKPEDGLAALAGALPELTLVAATDGNHGRALAVIARWLALPARIYVPENLTLARREAIAAEGAEVVVVDGSYDDAVAISAADADSRGDVLVSDTSWPGYEAVPGAVIDGYSTILRELDQQLAAMRAPTPDVVLVQLGVGAFGAAVTRHFRSRDDDVRIVGVEPEAAACVMASLAAGRITTVPGPHDSVMSGLNCGVPSLVAWPVLERGLDAVIAIPDAPVLDAVRWLADDGLDVGECSAGAAAAAVELLADEGHRTSLGVGSDATVLLFATEGVTDRDAFSRALAAEAA